MSDNETQKRILATVRQMLAEGQKAEELTVRQIAARAGVGIGTISYHYHSKDKLLSDAVAGMMESLAASLKQKEACTDPYKSLRDFLLTMGELSVKYYEISKIHVIYDIEQGDFSICYHIIPLLREILKDSKSELQIKLIAIQLITSMQSIFLKRDAFLMFSGLNISRAEQIEQAVDILLQNSIHI